MPLQGTGHTNQKGSHVKIEVELGGMLPQAKHTWINQMLGETQSSLPWASRGGSAPGNNTWSLRSCGSSSWCWFWRTAREEREVGTTQVSYVCVRSQLPRPPQSLCSVQCSQHSYTERAGPWEMGISCVRRNSLWNFVNGVTGDHHTGGRGKAMLAAVLPPLGR